MTDIENKFVKKIYNEIADHFDISHGYVWKCVKDYIESLKPMQNILEIGCGNGRNFMNINKHQYIGIDNSTELLKICKNKKFNVLLADMTSIPFKSNKFDNILCIASFHHLSTIERRKKTLFEMKRLLKSNGTILFTIWSKKQPIKTNRYFEFYGDNIVLYNKYGNQYKRYYYIFQKKEIEQLFTICGFKIKNNYWECGNEIYILE